VRVAARWLCLLVPLACLADAPPASVPSPSLGHVAAELTAPCQLPNARFVQFQRFGALNAYKPVDAQRGMYIEPGRYEVVVDCMRIADPVAGKCEELHKRKQRVYFDLEIEPAHRYVFSCKFEGKDILLFYRLSGPEDSP
jgi:hypothetical protein